MKYLLKIDISNFEVMHQHTMINFFEGKLKGKEVAEKLGLTRELFERYITAAIIVAIRDGEVTREGDEIKSIELDDQNFEVKE